MREFIRDYRGAFKPRCRMGLRQWILFTLKSLFLFVVLIILFSLAQYALLIFTPLSEHVTVSDVRISSLIGLFICLIISFMPSVLYLVRHVLR